MSVKCFICNKICTTNYALERHYARHNRVSTPKQTEAQIRNFNIKRLRGMAAHARIIPMPLSARNKILMGIDQALEALGADTERVHRQKQFAETLMAKIKLNPNL